MATPSNAVFLSYASEDAPAVQRIADTLRAAAIEVWFDREELRGGDAWDRRIREQIHDCRLFVPIISAHTEAREEGYFRREWKLAVDRTHDMAEKRAFLVPVVIDGTSERGASVPEKFRELQWTRLPAGETSPAFVERVRRLLVPESSSARAAATAVPPGSTTVRPVSAAWRSKPGAWAIGALLAVTLGYFAVDKLWITKRSTATSTAASAAPAFAPPPHSIAVLPFVNMSGDKDQEYFSDGLTEELLNSLSRINELQVSARTSSFSFKGKDADISTIAHKLNVASVLEGSVRRAGNTVRVTAQLNNALTGFHLWSQTYDRDLSNVLQLQTDIANAVANALKVTLLGDVAAKIEAGGTRNPAAFDEYLRASKSYWTIRNEQQTQVAIAGYSKAIRLDPDYALAYADRSLAFAYYARYWAQGSAVRDCLNKAQADARKAIALAPDLGEAHLALAYASELSLDFTGARQEYVRALALAPGNARVLKNYGGFAVLMGQTEAGLAAAHRAVVLDPLSISNHGWLGASLMVARSYDEAIAAYNDAKALRPPNERFGVPQLGYAYYAKGDLQSARSECESADDEDSDKPFCLAFVYHKLGRLADAATMLAKYRASSNGDAHPVWSAAIYAQWGDTARALDWLETALRRQDSELEYVKAVMLFDPLRKEPRFQAIERELRFPN